MKGLKGKGYVWMCDICGSTWFTTLKQRAHDCPYVRRHTAKPLMVPVKHRRAK